MISKQRDDEVTERMKQERRQRESTPRVDVQAAAAAMTWTPQLVGGSVRVAGMLGMVAEVNMAAGHVDNAYWFARWAASEANAFLHRMDKRFATPYLIHDPVEFANRRVC